MQKVLGGTVTTLMAFIFGYLFLSLLGQRPSFDPLWRGDPKAFYMLALIPIGLSALRLCIHLALRKQVSRGQWTFLIGAFTFSSFCWAAIFAYSVSLQVSPDRFDTIPIYGALFAAFFATFGWIITNYLNFLNARKTHTMNVLMQLRNSSGYIEHLHNIMNHIDIEVPLTDSKVEQLRRDLNLYKKLSATDRKNEPTPIWYSIQYILNYLEFICVGVNSGDLDKGMIYRSLRGILIHLYDFTQVFIEKAIKSDFGKPNSKLYFELRKLVQEFKIKG